MILRRDWREVLLRAWSIRFWALAILVQGVDVALPWFREDIPLDDRGFGLLTILFAVAGCLARLVPQKGITPPAAGGGA